MIVLFLSNNKGQYVISGISQMVDSSMMRICTHISSVNSINIYFLSDRSKIANAGLFEFQGDTIHDLLTSHHKDFGISVTCNTTYNYVQHIHTSF